MLTKSQNLSRVISRSLESDSCATPFNACRYHHNRYIPNDASNMLYHSSRDTSETTKIILRCHPWGTCVITSGWNNPHPLLKFNCFTIFRLCYYTLWENNRKHYSFKTLLLVIYDTYLLQNHHLGRTRGMRGMLTLPPHCSFSLCHF